MRRGQKKPRRRLDIIASHQRFANQETIDPGLGQPRQVVRHGETAFADDGAVPGYTIQQAFCRRQVNLEGFEVAVIDTDRLRLQLQGAIQFGFVMNFDQHVEPDSISGVFQFLSLGIVQRRHN